MKNSFNYDRAARIIAESALFGDKRTAEKNDISRQTLHNYRKRLDDDERLRQLVVRAKDTLITRWADRIVPTIIRTLDFLDRAIEVAGEDEVALKNPELWKRALGGVKLLSETVMGEKLLDARLSIAVRHGATEAGPLAGETEADEESRH